MAIFTNNITCNNEFYYIIPKIISEKLDDVYKNVFSGLEKEKIFFKKCSAFFSYFFKECEQWNELTYNKRISYKVLRAIFCNIKNKTYLDYINSFIDYKILKKTSNHSDKLKLCNEYQLADNLIDGNYILYVFNSKSIESYQLQNEVEGLDRRCLETLKNTKVDLNNCIKNEFDFYVQYNDTTRFFTRINRALYFNNTKKRKIQYGNKVNRIYHPLCFLTKISRECLNIRFHNLDIVNCQPLLLCYHLKNEALGIDEQFIIDVEAGNLYEKIQAELLKKESINIKRDEVKKMLYSEILFDFKRTRKTKKNLVNIIFSEIYPKTYNSLKGIHEESKKSNITLASILQNLEADLFNNLQVRDSEYYFTLFDAIYYSVKSDEDDLRNQIEFYFKKLGLNVVVSNN